MSRRYEINRILRKHIDVSKYEDYTDYKALITAIEDFIIKQKLNEIIQESEYVIKHEGAEKKDLNYWKKRCELAEEYIKESPCDPDITTKQIRAYLRWKEFIIKKE